MVIQDLFVERKEEMEMEMKMKILLINRWSQLETVGGAERVFFSMANALSERHEVTALAMTQTGAERPFLI